MNQKLSNFIEDSRVSYFIVGLILLNAVILGMETYPSIWIQYGILLHQLDLLILWIFVIELFLRMLASGSKIFKDPWYLFDIIVVGIAFLPASGSFSILRAVRVLRILRLITIFPTLRKILQGLITAIPGIGSIAIILFVIFYIFSVMATNLYGQTYPQYFGSLQTSLFSLFQIMTLEGWPDIVRQVLEKHPYAWVFFISYILISTFTVLNLFIAIIVDSMQKEHMAEEAAERDAITQIQHDITHLHQKIDQLK